MLTRNNPPVQYIWTEYCSKIQNVFASVDVEYGLKYTAAGNKNIFLDGGRVPIEFSSNKLITKGDGPSPFIALCSPVRVRIAEEGTR